MPIDIVKDVVQIKYFKERNWLIPEMPDGTKLPCVCSVNIYCTVGGLTKAEITLIANVEDFEATLPTEFKIIRKPNSIQKALHWLNKNFNHLRRC